MGIGFALGTGFFTRAKEVQDENRKSEAEDRRHMMNLWETTTLPDIRKARAIEEQGVRTMNDIMAADPRARENPALAYYVSKSVLSGVYKTPQEALDDFEKNPSSLPPELAKQQADTLAETFVYDTDQTTGKMSNFRLKPVADPEYSEMTNPPRKRTLGEIISGRQSPEATRLKATSDFRQATGYHPDESTTSRFMSGKTPELGVKPVDKEQKEFEKFAIKEGVTNPKLKNVGAALQALSKGPDEALKFLSNPGAYYTKEELDSEEFRTNIQNTLVKDFMENGTKYPEGAAQLISGKLSGQALVEYMQRGMKTPEEKAQFSLDNLVKQGLLTPSGTLDWVAALSRPDVVARLFPDEKTRAQAVDSMKRAIAASQSQDIINKLINSGALGALPGAEGLDGSSPAASQPEAEEDIPYTPGKGVVIGKVVPAGQPQAPQEKSPQGEQAPQRPRLGETSSGTPVVNNKVTEAIKTADTDTLSSANPFGVLEALVGPAAPKEVFSGNKVKQIVSSITMTDRDLNMYLSGKEPESFRQNLSTLADIHMDRVSKGQEGIFPEFASTEEAIVALEPGKFFIDKSTGNIGFVTAADKKALQSAE